MPVLTFTAMWVAALAVAVPVGPSGEVAREASQAAGAADPSWAAPDPDAALPTTPRELAARMRANDVALRRAIRSWRTDGDPSRGAPPEPVTLGALYQQRALRMLSRKPQLAERTIGRLSPRLARDVREVTVALRDIRRLSAGSLRGPRLRTQPAEPLGTLRDHYREAQRRFAVGAHVLAAVHLVESAFGKVRSDSSAGAQGPMQFLPATWRAYGLGGDIQDPRDAILGAANYLRASGAPGDYARALYAYNHSDLYVDAVRRYARFIDRDRDALSMLYSWQVFTKARDGSDRRVTGPGLATP